MCRCFPVFHIPAFPPHSWLICAVPEETEHFFPHLSNNFKILGIHPRTGSPNPCCQLYWECAGNGEGFSLLLQSPGTHPNPRFWEVLSRFSWKIWNVSGGTCGCEFQGVEETIPNQLECGRDVRKSLFTPRPGDPGANPCIHEGCEERDLEHKTVGKGWKMGNCVLSQISQVCQLCQQSPRLFSNHAAQLHTLLVSFWGETWEFCIPHRIPEEEIPWELQICILHCWAHPCLKTLWKQNSRMAWVGRGTSHYSRSLQQLLERKSHFSAEEIPWIWLFLGIFAIKVLSGSSSFMKGGGIWEESAGKREIQGFQLCPLEIVFCGSCGRGRIFAGNTELSIILRKLFFKLN